MKAIIKTGGKQYLVENGSEIYVEKLEVASGNTVTFDEVLSVDDKIGTPFVKGATVTGEVVRHGKGKKVTIFKYKAKKDYRNKTGHRQNYTLVKVTGINA